MEPRIAWTISGPLPWSLPRAPNSTAGWRRQPWSSPASGETLASWTMSLGITWRNFTILYGKKHMKKPWCDRLGSIQDMDRNASKWIDMDRNGTLNSKSLDLNRFDIMRWSSHGDTNPTTYHWLVVSSMLMISLNFLAYLDGQRLRQGDGICFAPSLRPLGIPRISDSSWNTVQKIQFPCFRCFSGAMLSMAISGT